MKKFWAKIEFLEQGRQLPYRQWRKVFSWRPKGGVEPSDTTRTSRIFSDRGAAEIIECPVDIDDYMVAPNAFPKHSDGKVLVIRSLLPYNHNLYVIIWPSL